MKIIVITDHFGGGGGVNSFVFDLCYSFIEQKQDVLLIGLLKTQNESEEINELAQKGVQILRLNAIGMRDALLKKLKTLRNIIKEYSNGENTVCNLHLKRSTLIGSLATIGMKSIKCIETYHNTYHHYHLQCFFQKMFIKKYICVSEEARREMLRRFHTAKNKTISIPNGISRRRIREFVSNTANTDGSSSSAELNIVSVGRLSYEKNFSIPIKAISSIWDRNIKYTIVGGGPEENALRELSNDSTRITLLGSLPREKAIQELSKGSILIMSSLWEGRSILQLEAAALDMPMILSDVPGLREPFHEKELDSTELFRVCSFGYLVRTNDVDSYKAAVCHYYDNRKELEDGMKASVGKMSIENDMKSVACRYIDCFKDCF